MIESELKVDPQFKSTDKAEPKADRKAKAKVAARLFSADKDLNHLEKAWSKTANEVKAMQRPFRISQLVLGIYNRIGHHSLSHLLMT